MDAHDAFRFAIAGAAGPLPAADPAGYPPGAVELPVELDELDTREAQPARIDRPAPRWAPFLTPGVRGYVYRVLCALGAVLGLYGYVSGDELAVWLALAGTVMGTGTAATFTGGRRAA